MDMQRISQDVILEKYSKGKERRVVEIFRRVASALSRVEEDAPKWERAFFEALEAGFVPAGRIWSAAGTDIKATLINCFVQPVGDAMTGKDKHGRPGIMDACAMAAETMRRGGGVGYNFSHIRPKDALVKGTASRASGPLSYMEVFDSMCQTVESAGARRGAQMGILNVEHPDIRAFIHAKDEPGKFTNFNLSVMVSDAFMEAVKNGAKWELVHGAEPFDRTGKRQREDGLWVYDVVDARELWAEIMASTYDHAEPGVLFSDRINADNNLHYVEEIEASNPCAEQPLPDYGCCCLGSINLTKFVREPFTEDARFDFEGFEALIPVAVRMLDNVLDVTYWPLPEQKAEAASKRRVGLGFLGLGDALVMLGIRYDSEAGRKMGSRIAQSLRDAAYKASVELAKEKGAFPLFDAGKYLKSGFAKRLPRDIRKAIRENGIRNSHLTSIAPTGTISLAFADNASNGIEPPFSWVYTRKKRTADGGHEEYEVADHAWRLYREMGGDVDNLPDYFVSALEMSVDAHVGMVNAVAPFIDTAISKTVNIPVDYPFEDFADLYMKAWQGDAKGLATFRPNAVTGSVLSTGTESSPSDLDTSDPDRRIRLKAIPEPTLASLRWAKRPNPEGGNPSWTYLLRGERSKFAVFIGHLENGCNEPFEVWVNGGEQPRGIGALAKSLSMDMRSRDRAWLKTKLEALLKTPGEEPVMVGEICYPSAVAAFARVVLDRCQALGAFESAEETPVLDALMSPKEPKTGPDGTMGWMADIKNPNTGDDFVMGVKELVLPDGQRRPYSVWLSGDYPRALDGLCKSLSYDMRVIDPAWVGGKLRQLLNLAEPAGDFFARVPGGEKQEVYPSTVAYMARLLIHRYAMLSILDEEGYPVDAMGVVMMGEDPEVIRENQVAGLELVMAEEPKRSVGAMETGKACRECGSYSLIRKDGCDFCTACGAVGSCG